MLSVSPVLDYSQVTPVWFETVEAASFEQQWAAKSLSSTTSPNSPAAEDVEGTTIDDRWIVRLTPQAVSQVSSVAETADLLIQSGVEFDVIRGLGLPGQVLVRAAESDAATAEASLRANPHVAYFEVETPISGQVLPNDPRFPNDPDFASIWGLNNTEQTGGTENADIDAPEAWEITTGSSDIVVAVIDTGIDYTHPDLAANIWTNPGETPGDGIDNDGNGFVDDVHGYDFCNHDGDPMDDHRHGTHVAGTIAAVGDNAVGVTGVNWSSSLMALKFLDQNKGGDTSNAIRALNYATMMRATYGVNVRLTNNSWGYRGSSDPGLRDAIQAGGEAGILFVAAAGNGDILGRGIDNDADPEHAFYPASEDMDCIISVAASDHKDRLARFSNFGLESVDIAAPGVGILSTELESSYTFRSGTSMATAYVSGVAGLVWSDVPDATPAEVREAVFLGGDAIAALQDKLATGRRLNAYGALLVDTAAPRVTLVSAPDVTGPGGTELFIEVNYTDNRLVAYSSVQESQLMIADLFDPDPNRTLTATFYDADVQTDAPSCTVQYCLLAPGDSWDAAEDGDYQVVLESNQVWDTSYNDAPMQALGTFNIDTTPGLIRAGSFYDATDANPGDGVSDDGTGHSTLRSAIMEANAQTEVDNVIRLRTGTYTLSIAGTDEDVAAAGDLDVTHNLTIRGAGADKTTIDPSGLDRVFHVLPGVELRLLDVTIQNGSANLGGGIANSGALVVTDCAISGNSATGQGGGIFNDGAATVSITGSTLSDNSALASGGGLHNNGTATITNSTFSGNSTIAAGSSGGGIFNAGGATLTLINDTVAYNSAQASGGIHNEHTVGIKNTIVAENAAPIGPDASGGFTSQGNNLIGNLMA